MIQCIKTFLDQREQQKEQKESFEKQKEVVEKQVGYEYAKDGTVEEE